MCNTWLIPLYSTKLLASCSSKSNPDSRRPEALQGPCDFSDGLESRFPQFQFPIVDERARQLVRQGQSPTKPKDKPHGLGFGLLSDKDLMWTTQREGQKHQVRGINV